MPSFRKPREEAPNAIVGAARRVHLNRRDEIERLREKPSTEWQKLAWRHYDEIGEIKYAYNYFAAIASRVRLYVGYETDQGDTPSPIGEVGDLSRSFVTAAQYELSKLNNGIGGQPNFIRTAVLNLLVPGECYLVGHHNQWAIRSTSEIIFEENGRTRLRLSKMDNRVSGGSFLPESAYVARIWRTHPEYSDDADSSLRGLRGPCSELMLLSRLIRASVTSRLNAGLLYVADELRFQRSADPAGTEPQPDVDAFEEELNLALTEPIGDTDSPSEVVPMLVRGPAEFADSGIKKIDLSRPFDKEVIERHEQALQRVLNGLDLPRDLITGLANVRYSNAQTITEDLLKAHVEPMMVLICEALTTVYLRAQMEARGYDPKYVSKLAVWYDPSEVVTRPDRSEDADKGYGRMLVSASTWRRAHGFNETDAPSDEELALRIALSGSVAPSTTLDFIRKIAPDVVKEAERLAQESFGDPSLATNGEESNKPPADASAQPPTAEQPVGAVPEQATPPIAPTPDPTATPPPTDTHPPEGTLPPSFGNEKQNAQVLDIIHALTAGAPKSAVVKERTRKLELSLEVERRLRESLHVHLNDVVKRALERAGARTVSKIRGDADMKALVSDVTMEAVFASLPENRHGEFALNPKNLVGDTLEKAKSSYFDLVTRAQNQGWRALGVHDTMSEKQTEFLERSWGWLLKRLTTLAVGWLKKPRTTGNYVDMETIRTATALAGGGSVMDLELLEITDGEDTVKVERATPKDSGRAVLSTEAINATGWEISDRYRWVYGISENTYEPHLKLDDKVFSAWTDKSLASKNPEEWPYVTHHYPGDHNGCRCDWLPEVLDPAQVNEARRGQTWDEDAFPIAAGAFNTNGHNLVLSSRNGHKEPVEQTNRT